MNVINLSSKKKYEISGNLYMQFMEPLGRTDGSVEAAWDFEKNDWRDDVVTVTAELKPSLIRFGGVFSAYYRWKEGVGPQYERKPVFNVEWGGLESGAVGTREFVDFCRRVGAEPFINVNFESDGRRRWAFPGFTKEDRRGFASEAAQWVDYCNNPKNRLRIAHGDKPFNVKLWQIGNETSHIKDGFSAAETAKKTKEFARAMRGADADIKLMGWGDHGYIHAVMEEAGEYLDYIDYHNLFGKELNQSNSPLLNKDYRLDAGRTWDAMMSAYKYNEHKLQIMRDDVRNYDVKLALCESHFDLQSRNRGEVLSTWAAGAAAARICNLYERNGDILKIANISDFCGNCWMVNSVMIPTPGYWGRKAYLMPVGLVSKLFSRHMGDYAVDAAGDGYLDISASCGANNEYFIHVVNTSFDKSVRTGFSVDGVAVSSGTVYELCAHPLFEVDEFSYPELCEKEKNFCGSEWIFPPASVSAVKITAVR